jgi:hypothetical protein
MIFFSQISNTQKSHIKKKTAGERLTLQHCINKLAHRPRNTPNLAKHIHHKAPSEEHLSNKRT